MLHFDLQVCLIWDWPAGFWEKIKPKSFSEVSAHSLVYRDLHQMIFPCLGEFLLGDLTHI